MKTTKSRDYSFDALKGFLIILVILGHSLQISTDVGGWSLNPLFMAIYTFHMPLFIFISGYFSLSIFKKKDRDVFTNKFKRLLVPTIIYSSIICIIYFTSTISEDTSLIRKLYKCYKIYWYLINVFSLTLIFKIALKTKYTKVVFVFLYITLLLGYNHLPPYYLKDCQIIRMIPIFGLGLLYRKYQEPFLKLMSQKKYLITTIVFILGWLIVVRNIWGWNIIKYPILIRIGDGICCCSIVFFIFKYLYPKMRDGYVKRWLILTGQQSLILYLVHVVIVKYLIYNSYIPEFSYLGAVFMTAVLYICCALVLFIIKRVIPDKSQYILGVS